MQTVGGCISFKVSLMMIWIFYFKPCLADLESPKTRTERDKINCVTRWMFLIDQYRYRVWYFLFVR
jgi:hypothetical protein